jgi:hypothetical protein
VEGQGEIVKEKFSINLLAPITGTLMSVPVDLRCDLCIVVVPSDLPDRDAAIAYWSQIAIPVLPVVRHDGDFAIIVARVGVLEFLSENGDETNRKILDGVTMSQMAMMIEGQPRRLIIGDYGRVSFGDQGLS